MTLTQCSGCEKLVKCDGGARNICILGGTHVDIESIDSCSKNRPMSRRVDET